MGVDIPRTAKGKSCKKCLDLFGTGARCHQHSHFSNFSNLPKPALQQVLLNMGNEELKKTCVLSKEASLICKTAEFQRLYKIRHPTPTFFVKRMLKKEIKIHNPVLYWFESSGQVEDKSSWYYCRSPGCRRHKIYNTITEDSIHFYIEGKVLKSLRDPKPLVLKKGTDEFEDRRVFITRKEAEIFKKTFKKNAVEKRP